MGRGGGYLCVGGPCGCVALHVIHDSTVGAHHTLHRPHLVALATRGRALEGREKRDRGEKRERERKGERECKETWGKRERKLEGVRKSEGVVMKDNSEVGSRRKKHAVSEMKRGRMWCRSVKGSQKDNEE